MPLDYKTIEATVEARAMCADIAGISEKVRGWIAILVDSYNLSVAAGQMFHATMGQQDHTAELGSEDAAREAEKVLLWAKEACEDALKQAGEWES